MQLTELFIWNETQRPEEKAVKIHHLSEHRGLEVQALMEQVMSMPNRRVGLAPSSRRLQMRVSEVRNCDTVPGHPDVSTHDKENVRQTFKVQV